MTLATDGNTSHDTTPQSQTQALTQKVSSLQIDVNTSHLGTHQARKPGTSNTGRDLEMLADPFRRQYLMSDGAEPKFDMNDTWNGDGSSESSKLFSTKDNRTSEKSVGGTIDKYGSGNYDKLPPTLVEFSHECSNETVNTIEQKWQSVAKCTITQKTAHTDHSESAAIATESNLMSRDVASTMDSHASSRVSDSDTKNVSPWDSGVSNPFLSCDQRCGEATTYPCSCDEKCVVYMTCCEDLPKTCPEIYYLALTKFGHLMSSSVRCDTTLAVFVVESCPKRPRDKNTEVRSLPTQTDCEYGSRTVCSLSDILLGAPVTDYNTGIIFANTSIYGCNKPGKSHSPSQTRPSAIATWETQIGTVDRRSPVKVANVPQEMDLDMYSYVPPKSHPSSAGSLCYTNWHLACVKGISIHLENRPGTCNTSVIEYYQKRRYYRFITEAELNVTREFCGYCLARYQRSMEQGERFFLSGFKVLISLADKPGQVLYNIHEDTKRLPKPVPWSSWTCDLEDPAWHGQDSPRCRVLQCDRRYILTSDGFCRKAAEVDIAIQDDILVKGKKCRLDRVALVQFLTCYVLEFYKLKATDKPFRFYQTYDSRPNISLLAIRMEMFFEGEPFETHLMDLSRTFDTFYQTLLYFARYHCVTSEGEQGGNQSRAEIYSSTLLSQQSYAANPSKTREKEDVSATGNKNCNKTYPLDPFFVSLCAQVDPFDKSLNDEIKCAMRIDSLMLETDILVNDCLTTGDSLKCIKKEDAAYTSNGRKNCNNISMVYLIALTIILRLWQEKLIGIELKKKQEVNVDIVLIHDLKTARTEIN